MTAQEIIDSLSSDDIIKILYHLGASSHLENEAAVIFPTICHNEFEDGSLKLYYYKENKNFICYTHCDNIGNLFNLIMLKLDIEFKEAFNYVCNFFSIKTSTKQITGFGANVDRFSEDRLYFDKCSKIDNVKINCPIITKDGFMENFIKLYHADWLNDNISKKSMRKYDIAFDLEQQKIIIPHKNEFGKLIGVRCRSFDEIDLKQGRKYMPYLDLSSKIMYNHSLKHNLYGFYENKGAIKKYKKVILVESEKGVLQADSYLHNENIVLSVCGSNVSKYQRNMILSLNVDEVILAFDKQYTVIDSEEYKLWDNKFKKIASLFTPYVNFSIMRDYNNLLDYKDSPTDKGKDIFLKLYKDREYFN